MKKEYKPFQRPDGTWVIWDPNQKRLRRLKGVRMGAKVADVDVQGLLEKNKKHKKHKKHKTQKTRGIKKVVPKVVPDVRIPVTLPNGEVVELRGDGHIWHKPQAYGGQACVPIKKGHFLRLLTGDKKGADKVEVEFLSQPDLEWKIPEEILKEWCRRLLWFNTEALLVYGKLELEGGSEGGSEGENGKSEWMAVVPKQEVTGGGVDVNDFGPAIQRLATMGYRRVGSIHTHPGSGSIASGMDKTDLFDGFGGLHLIVGRTGIVNYYYSMGGTTWRLTEDKDSPWHIGRLWVGSIEGSREPLSSVVTERGGRDISRMVKHKVVPQVEQIVQTQAQTPKGFFQSSYTSIPYTRHEYPQPQSQHFEPGREIFDAEGDWNKKRRITLGDGTVWEWDPSTQTAKEVREVKETKEMEGGEIVQAAGQRRITGDNWWLALERADSVSEIISLLRMERGILPSAEGAYIERLAGEFRTLRMSMYNFDKVLERCPVIEGRRGLTLLEEAVNKIKNTLFQIEFELLGPLGYEYEKGEFI